MKKIISSIIVSLFFTTTISAQLKVDSIGQVYLRKRMTIGTNTTTNKNAAITIGKTNSGTLNPVYGVYSVIETENSAPNGDCIGLYGYANNSDGNYGFPVRMVGFFGKSRKNSTLATCFGAGVAGIANYYGGIGVYGAISDNLPASFSTSQTYAGYFAGNLKVTSTVYANTITTTSDANLKYDIKSIESLNAIDNIIKLNPISYRYKQIEWTDTLINDSGKVTTKIIKLFDEDSDNYQKIHYGLIAQEVQKIYPNLVYEKGEKYLSLNYIELIPLLIQSIKELNEKINTIENQSIADKVKVKTSSKDTESILVAELFQNSPNPFSENTEIAYTLPESVQTAAIYLYDMNGVQLDSYILSKRGNSTLTISGGQLAAGMYLYTLIADGKVVDTKRMILTK